MPMTLVTALYFPLKEKGAFLLGVVSRRASFVTGKLGRVGGLKPR